MSFNDDFLKRQANPAELGAVVHQQESALQQTSQAYVRMQSLDEVAGEIGELQFRATSASGQLRMIMSAINLLDELGIDAHLAGINENGVVQFYVNADNGKLLAGGGNIFLDQYGINLKNELGAVYIEDSSGDQYAMSIGAGPNDHIQLTNDVDGIDFFITTALGQSLYASLTEAPGIPDVIQLNLSPGPDGALLSLGGTVEIWGGKDGKETVFNKDGSDVDVVSKDNAGADIFRSDAAEKRLEIGADHYLPTRNSSDPNVKFNEANQDMDLQVEGVDNITFKVDGGENQIEIAEDHVIATRDSTDPRVRFNIDGFDMDVLFNTVNQDGMLTIDGGLDAIGVGGAAESGYALKVTGKLKVTEGITAENNANDLFRCDSPGGASLFTGTIATLPGGAVLTYNVSSGNEGAMVPVSTSQLAKMRLYNTTRGTSALISNCNAGTNTLTLTANVPAGWQVGDTITIVSQTVSGGIFNWVDLEITSGPTGKTSMFSSLIVQSATAGNTIAVHPFETFGGGKVQALRAHVTNIVSDGFALVKVTSNVFSMAWTGSPTAVVLRELGYLQ